MFKVNNTHSTPCFSVSIVNFEHVIAGWVVLILQYLKNVFSRQKKTYEKDIFYEIGDIPPLY